MTEISEERSIQLESYDIELINQTVTNLKNWVKQPWPESYCACESQFVEVMNILQSRQYTLACEQIKQQNPQVSREIEEKKQAIVDARTLLNGKYSQDDDEIFRHLDGRLGPVPGYSIVMEAYHGCDMDNLGKDIRRFRQSVSDLMIELQNVIEKTAETKRKTIPGKNTGKKKPGRPKVNEAEVVIRRKYNADWKRAKEAKVSKDDFSNDNRIKVEYLNNCVLRWCLDHS